MSDLLVIASSCDRLFGTNIFSFLSTTVASGGVTGNGFQFGQTGGLSGGIHFGTGVPYGYLFTGCHIKYTGGTGFGASIIVHGNISITFGLATGPRQFSQCGFNNLGKPYTAIGGSTLNPKYDESGWFAHANTWHYVELETVVDSVPDPDDANYILVEANNQMWVDGRIAVPYRDSNVFAARVLAEEGAAIGRVQISGVGSSTMVDNIYVGTVRLGGVRIQRYLPTADGSHTDWTPSSSPPGDLYVEIDESGSTNYSDYVFSETVGDKASFTFGPLGSDILEIVGIDWNIISGGLEDSSPTETRGLTQFILTGSPVTRYDSFDWFVPGNSGLDYRYGLSTNPSTGENFTIEEIEAAEFGFELTG
jgi:hypothetical protein